MVKISVKPTGIIRKFTDQTILEIPSGQNSEDIIRLLDIPHDVRPIVFVNNRKALKNQEIVDGDELTIVSLVVGG